MPTRHDDRPSFHHDTVRLDQHFLNPAVARSLVDEVRINPDDIVVDLGAGTGIITAEVLRRHPRQVIAVELDRRCAPALMRLAADNPLLCVWFGRIQNVDPADIADTTMIVANPPFSTLEHVSALMRKLEHLRVAHICVSRHWAAAAMADPSDAHYSLVSLCVRTRFDLTVIREIDGHGFTPPIDRPAGWVRFTPVTQSDPLLDFVADAAMHAAGQRVKEVLRSPRLRALRLPRGRLEALRGDPTIKKFQQRRLAALTGQQLSQLVRSISGTIEEAGSTVGDDAQVADG